MTPTLSIENVLIVLDRIVERDRLLIKIIIPNLIYYIIVKNVIHIYVCNVLTEHLPK